MRLCPTRNPTATVTDCGEVTCSLFSCLSACCSCHKQHGLQSKERPEGGGREAIRINQLQASLKQKCWTGKE